MKRSDRGEEKGKGNRQGAGMGKEGPTGSEETFDTFNPDDDRKIEFRSREALEFRPGLCVLTIRAIGSF